MVFIITEFICLACCSDLSSSWTYFSFHRPVTASGSEQLGWEWFGVGGGGWMAGWKILWTAAPHWHPVDPPAFHIVNPVNFVNSDFCWFWKSWINNLILLMRTSDPQRVLEF